MANSGCAGSKRKFNSQQLFASQNEIVIEHLGEQYRLRITSNGKLILTK
ncbi:MAG: hemin uptake protein HemP [Methylomonas sp.]|nr:hemin uptake protein HemP [Methylomonas sp.]MCK9606183.1 hemin uptake protein HemP [Methylomonas sp.]